MKATENAGENHREKWWDGNRNSTRVCSNSTYHLLGRVSDWSIFTISLRVVEHIQKAGIIILLFSMLSSPTQSAVKDDLHIFTEKDMYALAQKLVKSLRKCKQVRRRPDVIVDLDNRTNDFIDKTKFSELVHSLIEGKTHVSPATNFPEYEIRAVLTSEKQISRQTYKTIYRLAAEVTQANEKFCKSTVKLTKLSSLGTK